MLVPYVHVSIKVDSFSKNHFFKSLFKLMLLRKLSTIWSFKILGPFSENPYYLYPDTTAKVKLEIDFV